MSFEARVKELGLTIPELPRPAFSYVPAVKTGNLIYASGQTPSIAGKLTMQGKLGREISLEQGQEGARLCQCGAIAGPQDCDNLRHSQRNYQATAAVTRTAADQHS